MINVIQAQYDQLNEIATRFGNQAEVNAEIQGKLAQSFHTLTQDGWSGKGQASFSREMTNDLFPAMQRLIQTLEEAKSVTLQAKEIIQLAEEEAKTLFTTGEYISVDRATKLGDGDIRITDMKEVTNGQLFVGEGDDLTVNTYNIPEFLRPLFGGASMFTPITGYVHPNDITQQSLGDCFLLSSLATVAEQRPDLIRNAVQDNGDGTYTVELYRKDESIFGDEYVLEKVVVTPEFPEGEVYSKASGTWVPATIHAGDADNLYGQQELWPHLIEKAYGQLKADGDAGEGYEILNQGGKSHHALEALAGADSTTKSPQEYSLGQLAEMNDQGYGMTISSLPNQPGKLSDYRDKTLVRGHAYWIEDVNSSTGEVTIRNPWGYNDSKMNKIVMNYDDLDRYFRGITVNPLSN